MAGHVYEKTWGEVSDQANRALGKLTETLARCEELYQDMIVLFSARKNKDEDVAAQLFSTNPPTEDQLAMTQDWKEALEGVHALYTDPDLVAVRKMVTSVR